MIGVTFLIFCMLLSGCVTMSDKEKTVAEGTAVGAAVGTALGAVIGGGRGAAIGAAIGGATGLTIGNIIAQRKNQYANREEFLTGEIQRVAEYNEKAREYNKQLQVEIARLSKEVDYLQTEHAQGEARKESLIAKKNELSKQLEFNDELEQDLSNELDVLIAIIEEEQERGSEADESIHISELEQEIFELGNNLAELREGSVQLASINERLQL
jgi:chromosome segregation ATPase